MLGAGYIAVEMAGIFHGLGSETHLFFRGDTVRQSVEPRPHRKVEPRQSGAAVSKAHGG